MCQFSLHAVFCQIGPLLLYDLRKPAPDLFFARVPVNRRPHFKIRVICTPDIQPLKNFAFSFFFLSMRFPRNKKDAWTPNNPRLLSGFVQQIDPTFFHK